jgi:putative cardiolipin synthase
MRRLRAARSIPGRSFLRALAVLVPVLLLGACSSLPTDYPRSESHAYTDTATTRLGRGFGAQAAEHPGRSGVVALARGLDAFVARFALAELAERSLDVQYYIWHGDTTGRLLIDALLRAAERGVRLRLLLDDVGTAADDMALLMLDAHPNVEVRLFNPLAGRGARNLSLVADFERSNRRMHNKSFTADNQAAIVGGRNIGDEYFEARADVGFADLDVVVNGPAVAQVSTGFDRYWNSPAAFPIAALTGVRPDAGDIVAARAALEEFSRSQRATPYAEALKSSRLAQAMREGTLAASYGQVRVVYDDPSKAAGNADKEALLLPQLMPEIEALRAELLLVSPYFVPGEAGVAKLRSLRSRGIRVRVVTNSLAATDVPLVHSGYARYRRPLLEAGIELYEVKPTAELAEARREEKRERSEGAAHRVSGSSRASLHAKTQVFDRRAAFVGSLNLDPRSVFTNTETGVVIDNPPLVDEMLQTFDRQLPALAYRLTLQPGGDLEWVDSGADGKEVRYRSEPETGTWQRIKVWFYSLWPLEPLL